MIWHCTRKWAWIVVFCSAFPALSHANWRAFTDETGSVTIGALDGSLSASLVLDCAPFITLVTAENYRPGRAGLSGEYDNGLSFRIEARVPDDLVHTVNVVRPDQISALVRGLKNRHALEITDPNGNVYAFDLAGFRTVWQSTCGKLG